MLKEITDDVFVVGDVWTYETRENETESRIIVLRVDQDGEQIIVHIRLEGLQLKNPHRPGGKSSIVAHLPYDKAALQRIVKEKVGRTAVSDLGGYIRWREAYSKGKAGINNLPIKDILGAIEQTLREPAR